VSVDLGSSDIVLTSHNTDSSIAYGYHENRRLPVSFEVVVANGQATLKDHKVYLTDGDVSLRLVFESGETSWSVELPMKKDKGD
jgi:hypothetical protein